MFALGLKGPLPLDALRRFANDLGGALYAPFTQTGTGNWVAPINDHAMDRAFSIANRHGLVVLGVRQQRLGRGGPSYRSAVPPISLQVLGTKVTPPSERQTSVRKDASSKALEIDKSWFSDSASDALSRAATSTDGEALSTLHLFAALEVSDINGRWERLWLEAGDPNYLASLSLRDPESEIDGTWNGIAITRTCTVSLLIARRLSHIYRLGPAPIGALAFGLIANPRSAAAQALAVHGMQRSTLIDLLQEITIKIRVNDLSRLVREFSRDSPVVPLHDRKIMSNDGGYCHLVIQADSSSDGISTNVEALCGWIWSPPAFDDIQSPNMIPCPDCQEAFDAMPDRLEVEPDRPLWSPQMTEIMMPFKDGKIQLPY